MAGRADPRLAIRRSLRVGLVRSASKGRMALYERPALIGAGVLLGKTAADHAGKARLCYCRHDEGRAVLSGLSARHVAQHASRQ